MTSRDPLPPFRSRTVRLAAHVGWLALVAGLVAAWAADVVSDTRVVSAFSAAAASLAIIWILQWRNALRGRHGTVALGVWAILGILVVATVGLVPAMSGPALLLAFFIVAFSGLIASPVYHAAITAGVAVAYALAVLVNPRGSASDLVVATVALLIVGTVVGLATTRLRRQVAARLALDRELRRRDLAFERLYEVITTLTAGSSLRLALPELVGRIGRYFRAQVGLVALHNPDQANLEVVSPIWTAGYSLEIDRYIIPLTGSGEIEKAFVSDTAGIYDNLAGDPDAHSILGELGARSAMCVPLRIENRTIGVLVLADKEETDFDQHDLEALMSLSGPAALVVAQLERIEEAAESTRRMEDLARMKSDFVSVVSHELRTPLTSVIGSLATLSRPELAPASKQGKELLASARAQGDRLRRLIEDLLTTSRLEHGGLARTPSEIDLREFLREVVQTIQTEGRRVSIDVQEGAERLVADADHLSRIIINLVDNAMKYAGSSPVEIVASPNGDRLQLSIIDHGSGIRLQEREHAFERFTQLEPAQTRSQGGAGLGLSIVNGLVKAMGGSLSLIDTPGGGATFVVDLPTGIISDSSPLVAQSPLS